jgi:SAM-dependent methyltransferase
MTHSDLDLDRLLKVLWGSAFSNLVLFAHHSGLLEMIDSATTDGMSSIAVARRKRWRMRETNSLLDFLWRSNILEPTPKRGNSSRWRLTKFSRQWLVRSSDKYVGGFLARAHRLRSIYQYPETLLRNGAPDPSLFKATEAAFGVRQSDTLKFMQEMGSVSGPIFEDIITREDFSGVRSVLDVGCGSGVFCELLAKRVESARFVLFDRPGVINVLKKRQPWCAENKTVSLHPGNWRRGLPVGKYDLVILSHVLHEEPRKRARALFSAATRRLTPGGRILVIGFLEDETDIRAVFDFNILAEVGGDNLDVGQIRALAAKDAIREVAFSRSIGARSYWIGLKNR